jgi:hypothetical protein
MTTLTNCKRAAKKLTGDYVIVHTPGHVDNTKIATDRGYTILPVEQVKDFAAVIDRYLSLDGKPLDAISAPSLARVLEVI